MRPSYLLPLLLAVAAAPACVIELGDFGGIRASRQDALSYAPAGAVDEIFVDTFNGPVTIETAAGAGIEGSAKVWASGGTQERADARLAAMQWSFQQEGGRVTLKMSQPEGGSNNAGASAALKVPAGLRVLVDTSNGAVEIRGDFPYAWADTSNGHVTIEGAGEAFVDTSNGPVQVACNGKVVVDTSNGSVSYAGASPDFFLDTSNGNVRVALAGDWKGKGIVDTSNGSIALECAGFVDAALNADTSNGKVRVDGPALDKGAGSLRLNSSNGSITIKHGKQ